MHPAALQQDEARRAAGELAEIREGSSPPIQVAALAESSFARCDELASGPIAELSAAGRLACAPGCASCCHLEVSASFPEIARLAAFIEETFSPREHEALVARLDAQVAAIAPLSPRQRAASRTLCALLVNDRCSAYAARPLACRGWNSADVSPCREAFETPHAVPSVPVHRVLRDQALALGAGLGEGARAAGLDDAPLDLPKALAAALREGDGLIERWLSGALLPEEIKTRGAPAPSQGADGRWRW